MKAVVLLLTLFFFFGCQPNVALKEGYSQNSASQANTLAKEYQKALERASQQKKSYTQWFETEEKVPLSIVATAYIDPALKHTKEYRLLRNIAKNADHLPSRIKNKFSSITFKDFTKHRLYQKKFYTAYSLQRSPKEQLNDVLRPDVDTASAELVIGLDYNDLKKGDLTILGYKTIKTSTKKRNSYFFKLTKKGYAKLSKKQKHKALIDSFEAILELSIPEYMVVDRENLVENDKNLLFMIPQKRNYYTAEVWKYNINNSIKGIQSKIDTVYKDSFKISRKDKFDMSTNVIAFSPNNRYYAIGSFDLICKDTQTNKTIFKKDLHDNIISIVFSKDSRYLVASTYSEIYYFDIKRKKVLYHFTNDDFSIRAVAFSKNKNQLYVFKRTKIQLLDIKQKKWIKTIASGLDSNVNFGFYLDTDKNKLYIAYKGEIDEVELLSGTIKRIVLDQLQENIFSTILPYKKNKLILGDAISGRIYIVDKKSGSLIKIFKGHGNLITSLGICAKKEYLFSGSGDKSIRLWNLKNNQRAGVFENIDRGWIHDLAVSPNCDYLAVASGNKVVLLKQQLSNYAYKKIKSLQKKQQKIASSSSYMEFITKQLLFTTPFSNQDKNTLYKYGFITSKQLTAKTIKEIEDALHYSLYDPVLVQKVPLYAKQNHLFAQTYNDILFLKSKTVFDNELYFSSSFTLKDAGYELSKKISNIFFNGFSYDFHSDRVRDIAFLTPTKVLSIGKKAVLWDMNTKEELQSFSSVISDYDKMALSPDKKTALFSLRENNGEIIMFNLQTAKEIKTLYGQNSQIAGITFSPDGKYAYSIGYWDKKMVCWDILRKRKLYQERFNNSLYSIAINNDGSLVAISIDAHQRGSNDYFSNIIIFDTKHQKVIKTIKNAVEYRITKLIFSKDNRHIFASGSSGDIKSFSLYTGRENGSYNGHSSDVYIALFNNDRYMISVGEEGKVLIWDVMRNKLLHTYSDFYHKNDLTSVTISPDEKFALIGDNDGVIHYLPLIW